MKHVCYGLVLVLALLLQSAGSPGLTVYGARPELILLLALLFTLIEGPAAGAVFGFVGGFLQDLQAGRFVGLSASTIMVAALVLGLAGRRLYKENLLVSFFIVLAGTWAAQLLYLLGKAAFGIPIAWGPAVWLTVLGTGIFNAVIGIFLFRPLERLNKRIIYWDELLKRTG